MISWVRPGVRDVLTRRLRLTKILINDDFPTLDRPEKAISGNASGGYWDGLVALVMNLAVWMIMVSHQVSVSINAGINTFRYD